MLAILPLCHLSRFHPAAIGGPGARCANSRARYGRSTALLSGPVFIPGAGTHLAAPAIELALFVCWPLVSMTCWASSS